MLGSISRARIRKRILQRTRAERHRDAAAIIRRGMQVRACLDVRGRGAHELSDRTPRRDAADQGGDIDPDRAIADAAEPERRFNAATCIIQRDLCGRGDERKIRLASADLLETGPNPLMAPDRKTHRSHAIA